MAEKSDPNASSHESPTLRSSTLEEELERDILAGNVPEDFLLVTEPSSSTEAGLPRQFGGATGKTEGDTENAQTDWELATAIQNKLDLKEKNDSRGENVSFPAGNEQVMPPQIQSESTVVGKLTLTIVEAKLAKNYGLTRMDPYCRFRLGHITKETPTCPNGSKEPKWNNTFSCWLLKGIRNIDVEIFDECTFSSDALIAYGSFPIPEAVTERFQVVDEWLSLSGNEGPGKEGMLHIILSLQPGQAYELPSNSSTLDNNISDEEVNELTVIFPNLGKDVICSVVAATGRNREEAINKLLQLSTES